MRFKGARSSPHSRGDPYADSGRDTALGMLVLVLGVAACAAAMVPLRDHLSVATTALVLVVPVVAGVAVGGFWVGVAGAALGFVVYDYLFIPPYLTLSVGVTQNWVALGVYVVVVLVVARVVAELRRARAGAHRRAEGTRRLLAVSELLIEDHPLASLLDAVVTSVRRLLDLDTVALVLEDGGDLRVVASDGAGLSVDDMSRLGLMAGSTGPVPLHNGALRTIPLVTMGKPVGLLVLSGHGDSGDEELLSTLANHAALALDREQLREHVTRAKILEAVDHWRSVLLGSVAHDLRTPLTAVKVAISELRDPGVDLGESERHDLLAMIEEEADRLARLVTNILDMSRIEAGVLEPRRNRVGVSRLVEQAAHRLEVAIQLAGDPALCPTITVDVPGDLPDLDVDEALAVEALVNLMDNALRHAPGGTKVEVSARRGKPGASNVVITVRDHGPGVDPTGGSGMFELLARAGPKGPSDGSGLGLAIVKAFVEAQGGHVGMGHPPGGGAAFWIDLPIGGPDES
ncbi:MAG: ATP-binding protein [Acidimicrobiales bacterium]